MKALVYHGPGQRGWDPVDDPTIIEVDPTIFATHRYPLDDTMTAYDTFADAENTHALNVVLEGGRRDGSSSGHVAASLTAGAA